MTATKWVGQHWWSELVCKDPEILAKHYAALCGWTVDEWPMPEGRYFVGRASTGDGVAGFGDARALPDFAGMGPIWVAYFAVPDVDAAAELAATTGSKLLRPIFEVPDIGRVALIRDPEGVVSGVMTPP